jgi:hypothetical protein
VFELVADVFVAIDFFGGGVGPDACFPDLKITPDFCCGLF